MLELKIENFLIIFLRIFCDSVIRCERKKGFADFFLAKEYQKNFKFSKNIEKNTIKESCTKKVQFSTWRRYSHFFYSLCKFIFWVEPIYLEVVLSRNRTHCICFNIMFLTTKYLLTALTILYVSFVLHFYNAYYITIRSQIPTIDQFTIIKN